MSRKIILRIAKNICIFYECLCKASVKLCVKCLEGTTERSDSNRVRSARIDGTRTMCLEGTTPQDMQFVHRKRRTAFQAELLQQFLPRTSSPVTIATLSSAFQAQTLHLYKPISGQNATLHL